MKQYVYLKNNKVFNILPEFDDKFPNVPIAKRYSESFLANCVVVDEDVEIRQGYIYCDGLFTEPEVIPETEPEVIPETEPEVIPETEPEVIPETEPTVEPEEVTEN